MLNRPKARQLQRLHPGIWKRGVAACKREAQTTVAGIRANDPNDEFSETGQYLGTMPTLKDVRTITFPSCDNCAAQGIPCAPWHR